MSNTNMNDFSDEKFIKELFEKDLLGERWEIVQSSDVPLVERISPIDHRRLPSRYDWRRINDAIKNVKANYNNCWGAEAREKELKFLYQGRGVLKSYLLNLGFDSGVLEKEAEEILNGVAK